MLAETRAFFAGRGVLEIETPVLGRYTVTEPAIESVGVTMAGTRYFLQTSPEYPMKRLLAAGVGDIYQLARVFRLGEAGQRHNPEFTLLEWYRVGMSFDALIDETVALIAQLVARPAAAVRWRFDTLLARQLGLAAAADASALRAGLAAAGVEVAAEGLDRRELLDIAYDEAVRRAGAGIIVVDAFPADAAALARVTTGADGQRWASRFEVIVDGIELANGYDELRDAEEQAARFAADRDRRRQRGFAEPEDDPYLLAALAVGLPACCGVAVGFDRLVMLRAGAARIADVLAFDVSRV